MSDLDRNISEIVMYQPDETIRLEVRVEDDTVWLTQQQIASLFLRERSVISRHINNVFKEGECEKESNVHFLHIPNSDKPVMYYSLDVIISVGYRVKSLNGTKFRRWANGVLKQYLLVVRLHPDARPHGRGADKPNQRQHDGEYTGMKNGNNVRYGKDNSTEYGDYDSLI